MNVNGSLHVLLLGIDPNSGEGRYAITFAPYRGRGGALPAREAVGDAALTQFLSEIDIKSDDRNRVLSELHKNGRASLPNTVLTDEQLRKYGLAEMSILRSIISYLST